MTRTATFAGTLCRAADAAQARAKKAAKEAEKAAAHKRMDELSALTAKSDADRAARVRVTLQALTAPQG